jgi:hypothetical protein
MLSPHAPAAAGTAATMLEALRAELAGMGWTARLKAGPGETLALHVANPAAGQLSDDIRAAQDPGGSWQCCWSEPIPGEAAEVAAVITRALRAADSCQ